MSFFEGWTRWTCNIWSGSSTLLGYQLLFFMPQSIAWRSVIHWCDFSACGWTIVELCSHPQKKCSVSSLKSSLRITWFQASGQMSEIRRLVQFRIAGVTGWRGHGDGAEAASSVWTCLVWSLVITMNHDRNAHLAMGSRTSQLETSD